MTLSTGSLLNDWNNFRAKRENFTVYANLDVVDQRALMRGTGVGSYTLCDLFTTLGWMRFTGNQHNENWNWQHTWLESLEKAGELGAFYAFMRQLEA